MFPKPAVPKQSLWCQGLIWFSECSGPSGSSSATGIVICIQTSLLGTQGFSFRFSLMKIHIQHKLHLFCVLHLQVVSTLLCLGNSVTHSQYQGPGGLALNLGLKPSENFSCLCLRDMDHCALGRSLSLPFSTALDFLAYNCESCVQGAQPSIRSVKL